MSSAYCNYEDCDRDALIRGYCQRHYQWLRRHGQIENVRTINVLGEHAGADCEICHTPLLDHPLTRACYLEVMYA